ncbi:hypothetical protein [Cupriavidus gilardii]|uniref:Uncharacterized protein n=1 Tax=Cupriavidus gilardii TaxID=82541 RepID=A0A849B9G9_9BURK|nr:hypothetical protein [Cupriavidus gilardii]KAB0596873.1 hypothetical protein F7Q96_10885 [Cupriavidus gilardii]MCT9014842.1 hypothetical protein [Cupriavidus gilardii]MCT9053254.1 hypothetical protein [Cupriavidus gilardii]NNH12351.1 hypothetical protein [Cupriavidus gilardii]WNG67341.1 hypothetical protein QWJ31_05860 [Cupriavidus gilardii]
MKRRTGQGAGGVFLSTSCIGGMFRMNRIADHGRPRQFGRCIRRFPKRKIKPKNAGEIATKMYRHCADVALASRVRRMAGKSANSHDGAYCVVTMFMSDLKYIKLIADLSSTRKGSHE